MLGLHGEKKHPHNPKPDATRAQVATNGSHHPPRFEPRPLPLWPGIETRHTNRSKEAADVPRFWLGRSGARRLLIPQPPQEPEKKLSTEEDKHPMLAGRSRTSETERFPTKTNKEKAAFNLQAWF